MAFCTAGRRKCHDSSKDKTLKLYAGHAHDLLNDYGREGVMGDIRAWLGAHLPK
jgi:alpha-beta hydrolase superfamily lysophospholipase